MSRLENGKQEHNLELLRNYARILHLPRHMLWFDFPGESRLILPPSVSGGHSQEDASRDSVLVANTGMNTVELLARVRASAIDSSTIDGIAITVDQLCCDYAHADATVLVEQGRLWLSQISRVLEQRVTFKQHRELLHNAGMLALLVGCLEYDLGDKAAAEATRKMAMHLGDESGDSNIIGWSNEMLAWFHLTAGNFRAVIPAAQAGIDAASSMSVAVQLYGQQAKAYARLGMASEVHAALERGSALLDTLPYPERPENHFVVDPEKWDFYAMDTYRIVGDNKHAKRNALEVIRRSISPDGLMTSPMRHTEAKLTLAVIAAREGEVEEASTLGLSALQQGRQSRPSLIMVGQELDTALRAHGAGAGSEFREVFANLRSAK
ncbi:XRE family transcriptional regulator [Lentzea sp. JNUCC 0626]|uniref:XRE family transcriptional regulator n=1 Tax=Lentzea sp. JNUCC 0626 TaxID=3367513 RepID=UPI00374A1BB4